MKLDNGIHNIPNEIYHSSQGLSRSALMEFKKSPYHYQQKYLVHAEPKEPTQAMILGNLIHTLVLEPNLFDDEFVVMPKFDRRTNAGKLGYNSFQSTLLGRACITLEDYDKAQLIASSVLQNPLAESLLVDSKIEQSIYFNEIETGIQCKARPDAWNNGIIIDLKTTADASFRAFQSSAFKYGYFLQAALIYSAMQSINQKMEKFVFIAVEKDPPYAVGIYVLDEEALQFGLTQFGELIRNYAQCLESNKWPGYPLQTLTLPRYANFEHVEQLEIE